MSVPLSPSKVFADFGARLVNKWGEDIRRAEARRAAGLPPEPISAEFFAYCEGVAKRSFWTCYEDEFPVKSQ